MPQLSKNWSIDKGTRVLGFKGSSEKSLKTNKDNTMILGVIFYRTYFCMD
jgi:hypothetical protein